MKNAAIGLIGLGLLSLVMSFVWPMISPKPPPMDEQQAERFSQAAGDAHGARTAGGVDPEDQKILDEQKEARAKADRTQAMGTNVFRYTGILVTLVGAGLFFWAAQQE